MLRLLWLRQPCQAISQLSLGVSPPRVHQELEIVAAHQIDQTARRGYRGHQRRLPCVSPILFARRGDEPFRYESGAAS